MGSINIKSPLAICALGLVLSLIPLELYSQKPTPNFSASPRVGCAPLTVHFEDQSTRDVIDWEWDVNNDGTPEYVADPLPSHVYTVPGFYSVRLTVTSFSDTASVTKVRYIRVTEAPRVTVSNYSVCEADSLQLRASVAGGVRPFSYFWSALNFPEVSTDSVPLVTPDTSGQWSLELTDSTGCMISTVFTIAVIPAPARPDVTRSGNVFSCTTAAAAYQWLHNGSVIAGATSRSYTLDTVVMRSGYIQIRIANSAGCFSKSDSVAIGTTSSVPVAGFPGEWRIEPNPATTEVRITRPAMNFGPATIDVYNSIGELVRSVAFDEHLAASRMVVSEFSPGVYLVVVNEYHSQHVFKLVKN